NDPDKKGKGSGKKDSGGSGSGRKDGPNKRQGKGDPNQDQSDDEDPEGRPEEQRGNSSSNEFWATLAKILKWIVIGILVLLGAFVVLRVLLKFLANFTQWADNLLKALSRWWENLWRRGEGVTLSNDAETA